MEFHDHLRTLLKNKRLSQESIAASLDMSQNAVSRWVTGKSVPDIHQAIQLAKLLEVTVGELIQENEGGKEDLTWQERAVVEIFRARVKAEGPEVMTPAEVAWRIEVPRTTFGDGSRVPG